MYIIVELLSFGDRAATVAECQSKRSPPEYVYQVRLSLEVVQGDTEAL